MNHLFEQYDQNFNLLRELEQDDLPRSLRLFNIRIRLAIDIQINFEGKISLTKTKEVREAYVSVIQLMELWNAYEALSHYVSEVTDHVAKKVSKSKIYTQAFLEKVDSLPMFKKTAEMIFNSYKSNPKFKNDFDVYIQIVECHEKLTASLKNDAASIREYVNENKTISGAEVLSLIYAERNMYYHNGETAKMGMSYSNRKILITWYKEALLDNILRVANAVIVECIEANR